MGGLVARAPAPPNGRGSPHQISKRHIESIRDEQQMVDERRVRTLLDPIDRLAIEAGAFGEPFLCEFVAQAFGPDVVPDSPALLQDPVGRGVGWHGYTLVGPVIDVCTIDGTFANRTGEASATHPVLKHSFA